MGKFNIKSPYQKVYIDLLQLEQKVHPRSSQEHAKEKAYK